jgi:hypothetical protein
MREKSTSSGLNNLISVSTNPAAGHNDHADTTPSTWPIAPLSGD